LPGLYHKAEPHQHGLYGNEGGEANKKKGQYTFSYQFGFIFLNMEAESEEVVQLKTLCKGRII
jgi:hypothetical protein